MINVDTNQINLLYVDSLAGQIPDKVMRDWKMHYPKVKYTYSETHEQHDGYSCGKYAILNSAFFSYVLSNEIVEFIDKHNGRPFELQEIDPDAYDIISIDDSIGSNKSEQANQPMRAVMNNKSYTRKNFFESFWEKITEAIEAILSLFGFTRKIEFYAPY